MTGPRNGGLNGHGDPASTETSGHPQNPRGEWSGGATGPLILDGRALARAREPELGRRAAAVAAARGHPPRLALVAFHLAADLPPFIVRKVRACERVEVEAVPHVLPSGIATEKARQAVETLARQAVDGIFLEFPFPAQIDAEELIGAVPVALDVDVMTATLTRRYLDEAWGEPPVTVEAALALLDTFGIDITGLDGVLIADPSPFAEMFNEALARRGARMRPRQPPEQAGSAVRGAELVVSAAAHPGLIRSNELASGAVVIDAGYFNEGGRGDVDTANGIEHLRALAPVPGAIGPMTISMLLERVIRRAERMGRA